MGGYSPLRIVGMASGLVQEREEFILPDDAYPVLQNAYVWRERIKRKQGCRLLGRLQRNLVNEPAGTTAYIAGSFVNGINIFSRLGVSVTEPNASIVPSSSPLFSVTIGTNTLTDNGDGTMTVTGAGSITAGKIFYNSGVILFSASAPSGAVAITVTISYNPNLPVMGLPTRELDNFNNEQLVAFDQKYAYIFDSGLESFKEFIPGTTWTGTDYNFFWPTNYWVNNTNQKLFWVTNFSGTTGDPIRYTDGTTWTNFAPQINAAGTNFLTQCLAILPFRSRLMAFNTYEGPNLAGSNNFPQRIRWAAIGNPIPNGAYQPWVDDVRGQGGFLDIPTSESIRSVGFVRDNLVIYCERSTWQLRYTGRSIAPFQIETVNPELGAESPFSAVQFDTSLVGIGDKGIVECDSYKSTRIDIKIPDLVFYFNNDANGPLRVHGIRDFFKRLAYWTYPFQSDNQFGFTYPNRRLVYNYENDSWAIFNDSFTTFGTYQPQSGVRWVDVKKTWASQNIPWINRPSQFPALVAGNQQGFVEYLDQQTSDDVSLFIQNITGLSPSATRITSPNHNLETGQVIEISGIPNTDPFFSVNGVFGVNVIDSSTFQIYKYNPVTGQFNDPQVNNSDTFIGIGLIQIRDNFSIVSKKFNFLDQGQNIQIGYIDILMDNTSNGAISLNVYLDYNNSQPINEYPENELGNTGQADTFFNTVVPTTAPINRGSTKNWQRVFCPSRGAFLTIEWTFSNAQMAGDEQKTDVQIDAQILWMRKAGPQLPIGI